MVVNITPHGYPVLFEACSQPGLQTGKRAKSRSRGVDTREPVLKIPGITPHLHVRKFGEGFGEEPRGESISQRNRGTEV